MTPENDFVDLVSKQYTNNMLGDDTAAKTAQYDSLNNALTAAREQELHGITMMQEAEKLKSQTLKNQQAEQKIELELANAQAKGLAVSTQDPKPAITPQEAQAGIRMPASGVQNPSQYLLNALNEARQVRKLSVGEKPQEESYVSKQEDYLIEQVMNQLNKVSSEKHLSRSPLGQAGSMIGGLLDIVSGPLDVGTELFGGTLPVEARTEVLTRALGYISPIARARATNLLGRDKYELTAERLLRKSGLGSATPLLKDTGDMEGADEIISLGIDMRTDIQNGIPDSFSSEATTGVGDAFNKFEQIHALIDSLRDASEEDAAMIEKKLVEADAEMREPIRQFLAAGGDPEKVKQDIVAAKKLINEKHQTPLPSASGAPLTKDMLQLQVKRKVVAKDLTDKLTDFYNAVVGGLPMDKEVVEKSKLGDERYAAKKRYEGAIQATVPDESKKSGVAYNKAGYLPSKKAEWTDTERVVSAAKKFMKGETQQELRASLDRMSMSKEELQKLKMLVLGELDSADKEAYMKVRNFFVDYQNKKAK